MERKKRSNRWTIFRENINIASRSIKSNKQRSAITIAIIALGITSLVGILTAVDALEKSIQDAYSKLGANTITISRNYKNKTGDPNKGRIRNEARISCSEAASFLSIFNTDASATIYVEALSGTAIAAGEKKTNPTSDIIASDEYYIDCNLYNIADGRNFSKIEIDGGYFYAIIGSTISNTLFGKSSPIGHTIYINGKNYSVIGMIEEVGNNAGGSIDNCVLVPYTNAQANLCKGTESYNIKILPQSGADPDIIEDEAIKCMRAARRLTPYDENDFRIRRSDAAMEEMEDNMRVLTTSAILIGLIILSGAAIGLMNIMLVAVKERTREIGTRKAIGATAGKIKQQFLMEAIIIGERGGIIGTICGIAIGNITAAIMKASFVIPWKWIIVAFLLCLTVGILSGYIPAKRAARLDPIECLRYE